MGVSFPYDVGRRLGFNTRPRRPCPACGRSIATKRDGSLHAHDAPNGTLCRAQASVAPTAQKDH